LELIRDAVVFDDLAYWTGRNRHGVHAAQRQLGACATLVDSLLSHPIKVALVAALTGRSSLDAISASRGLRQLNAALHALLMKLSGRNHLHDHLQRALLVRYVLQQTGKAHDPEVSALIAAVLCRERYSPQAHQQWRLTTYPPLAGLLHAADAAFTAPAFCSESCPPPRPPLRSPITAGSRPPIGAASRQRILVHRPDTFGPYPYAGSTS
jgi:hypothetical protein